MKIFGMEMNSKMALWFALHGLIIVDIVFITFAMFFDLPKDVSNNIQLFDLIICIMLLAEWSVAFYLSTPKTLFLKQWDNWVDLIAAIPFDVILPMILPQISVLRYLRLLKLLRIIALFNRFFNSFERFIKTTNIDKIIGGAVFTIIIFTLLLYIYGPTHNLFDDFYFVVVTLGTVGYGDITPVTHNEKVISIMMILVGMFVFSTITASISSYFTDRLINKGVSEVTLEEKLDEVSDKLDKVQQENKELKEEISDLKKLLKKD